MNGVPGQKSDIFGQWWRIDAQSEGSRIAIVQLLVSLGAEHGVLASDCLRGSAIAVGSLEELFFEVEASQELTVVRNLLHHLAHVPGIGLEAGRRYRLTGYGILGYALLSSGSLRSAIDFAVRYLDLTFAFNRYQTEKLAEGLRIVLDDRDVPEDCRQFLVERDAAATVALLRQLLLKPFPLHRATFRFERPSYAARFEEFFLGPVFFGRPVHEMVISNEWVDQPLPQADERTARLCEEQCRELLDRRRVRARMSERVRQHLCGHVAPPRWKGSQRSWEWHRALSIGTSPPKEPRSGSCWTRCVRPWLRRCSHTL